MSDLTPEEQAIIDARRAESAPLVIDEEGAEAVPSKTIANLPAPDPFDVPLVEEKWTHETIEFFGDTLHVRIPTEQAMSGLQLVGGKHTPEKVKANIFGLFIKNHLSPASYSRLFERLIDPNDPEYTPAAVGELMKTLAERAGEKITAAQEAAKTAAKA